MVLGVDLIHPWRLTTEELSGHFGDFSLSNGLVLLQVYCLCSPSGRRDSLIKEILKAFLPPPDNSPSQCQELSPLEALDGLPELL